MASRILSLLQFLCVSVYELGHAARCIISSCELTMLASHCERSLNLRSNTMRCRLVFRFIDGKREVLQRLAQIHTESGRDGIQRQVLLIPQHQPNLLCYQVQETLGPGTCYFSAAAADQGRFPVGNAGGVK